MLLKKTAVVTCPNIAHRRKGQAEVKTQVVKTTQKSQCYMQNNVNNVSFRVLD